jgi:hypothetical protein
MPNQKYSQEHWDEYARLVTTGLSGSAALRQLGIPRGSLGKLKERFNGSNSVVISDEPNSSPTTSQSIGELAQELDVYTESLLDLTAQLAELTKHAHGLVLLDKTLGQLEAKQQESGGLRRRLEEIENKLISRARVVHSND